MQDSRRSEQYTSAPANRYRRPDGSSRISRNLVQPQTRRSVDGIMTSKTPPNSKPGGQLSSSQPPGIIKNQNRASRKATPSIKPAMPRQSRSVVLARQMVKKKPAKRLPHFSRPKHITVMLSMMVITFVVAGGSVMYFSWDTNKMAAAKVEVLARSTEQDQDNTLSEEIIPDEIIASHKVAPDIPRLLKIPRLQTKARVKRVGINTHGELNTPTNIYDAGWYDGSAKPGEDGAVVIDGYVHGPTAPGIFYRLVNLTIGDTVELERGDGKVFTYKVVSSESVDQDKINMPKLLASVEIGRPGLNLITSTGRYDVRTNKYEQRLIVYMVQQ